jgi:hypothetical protein
MPSPFPGMDPYLEHPAPWPGVHQRLITYIGDALNTVMPRRYIADIGERLYIVQPERSIYPDVVILEHPTSQPQRDQRIGGTALLTVSDPPWVVTYEAVEMREVFIEILSAGDDSRVITVIEVLSPSNKTAGSAGRQLYLTKQQGLFESQTHLIEIDLLQRGEHTILAPREKLLLKGYWDYLVCLHRGGQVSQSEVWPIRLRQPQTRVCVPLADGDPDVVLDLQEVFDRCYDQGGYARRMNYRQEPPTLLHRDDAAWADALLRGKELRS